MQAIRGRKTGKVEDNPKIKAQSGAIDSRSALQKNSKVEETPDSKSRETAFARRFKETVMPDFDPASRNGSIIILRFQTEADHK